MKTDFFQSYDHCWVFQICCHTECSTFTALSFRIWNSPTGIPSSYSSSTVSRVCGFQHLILSVTWAGPLETASDHPRIPKPQVNYYQDTWLPGAHNILACCSGLSPSQNHVLSGRTSHWQFSEHVVILRGWKSFVGYLLHISKRMAAAKSLQSCSTLCDPIDGSPPGSPVPGILQARTLEWVAISFSNAWKWKGKVKSLSRVRLLGTQWTAALQASLSMGFSRQDYWSGCHCLLLIPNKHWQILMKRILSSGLWEDCYHTVDTLIMFLLYWLHFRLVSLWWDLTSVPTEHIYMSPGESRGRRSLVGYSQIWLSD